MTTNAVMAERLKSYAELMEEVSQLIEALPAEVAAALRVRYALGDELHGSALLAREDAAALLAPVAGAAQP